MQAVLNNACRQLGRALYSNRSISLSKDVERVAGALADALEATQFIGESAQQAYLETDPSSREMPETYTLRYRSFACQQIESAISMHDQLAERAGEAGTQEAETVAKELGLALADCLLSRDNLRAQIREDKAMIEKKEKEGLTREALIFCDGPS